MVDFVPKEPKKKRHMVIYVVYNKDYSKWKICECDRKVKVTPCTQKATDSHLGAASPAKKEVIEP